MSTLKVLHWNDVYKVGPQKADSGTVDVTQFSALVDDIRAGWATLPDGSKDGILVFSGDLFSPSVESTVTRGSHMVPIMNELAPDVALTGNHDFDFGRYPHLTTLVKSCTFPWILSNIIDTNTSRVPEFLREFQILERAGIRIGIIGLVEEEWITTVSSWPPNFVHKSMTETGMDLSRRLRDPEGEYKCDVIIALTHSRYDIQLAEELLVFSPSYQKDHPIANEHGVDLILGGHDHLYFVSKGATHWEGYDLSKTPNGAEKDVGEILVIKSGYDFRDLSEMEISFEDTPAGSVRKKVISSISGKHLRTEPGYRSSDTMKRLVDTLLSSVSSTLKAPVCKVTVPLDLRSQHIRMQESAGANWFADVMRHAYDDALCMKGGGGADAVFICAGTLRGDSVYGPGKMTLGNILEILPFEDPVVVLELDGATIWDALENSLMMWPAQEGRFPVISGMRVTWDSRRQPGERVLGVWLVAEPEETEDGSVSGEAEQQQPLVDIEPIKREKGGRMYRIVTRDYMAEGHDGYEALKGQTYLIDHEGGSLMSLLVRKYLLGSQFINKMSRISNGHHHLLGAHAQKAISREKAKIQKLERIVRDIFQHWKGLIHRQRSKGHFMTQYNVCVSEHMSGVDPFDGEKARRGQGLSFMREDEEDDSLLVVTPLVDGRLVDEARL
ncbi:hypothetical protein AMATHDRAFT_148390 [Amanita thiersii Skay4041]|uniref:5'-Nucleotidase C-terminal domain-containing protein n=1 Tax=Amanita thiersii Skay4041 TaxID=703135 RepID=A0A2A9NG93_9AGAR|nr:hypothetical protein AMATHDRAFT_148390 [Amanita thiersii Skay4041]